MKSVHMKLLNMAAVAVLEEIEGRGFVADGKLSATQFRDAWAEALQGEDLQVFETKARAALAIGGVSIRPIPPAAGRSRWGSIAGAARHPGRSSARSSRAAR